jgi:hypothetical protein
VEEKIKKREVVEERSERKKWTLMFFT